MIRVGANIDWASLMDEDAFRYVINVEVKWMREDLSELLRCV